jgi:transposase
MVEWIREQSIDLAVELDERGRRRWTAIEARSLGRGGIAAVAEATGISDRTIRTGLRELAAGNSLPPDRQRRAGAGRRGRQEDQPELVAALEQLISPTTRGEPTNPLRWTGKSTRRLATALRNQGFEVGASTVRALLRELGDSLQGNRKTREGKQPPDRNAQFEPIQARVKARKRRGEPALSVDTKKKEKRGNKRKSGREYEPQGHP